MSDAHQKPGQEKGPDPRETLFRLLGDLVRDLEPNTIEKWKTISRQIPLGATVRYIRPSPENGYSLPRVEFVSAAGEVMEQWEPARLKSVKKARPHKGDRGDRAEIQLRTIEPVKGDVAARIGRRMIYAHASLDKKERKE